MDLNNNTVVDLDVPDDLWLTQYQASAIRKGKFYIALSPEGTGKGNIHIFDINSADRKGTVAPSSKLHRYLLKQPSITLNPFLTPRSFMPRGELFSNRMKKFFKKVHLWLSLPAGIVIVITCLTGAMMVFQDEIEQLCHPRRYIVANYEGRTPLPYTAMSG